MNELTERGKAIRATIAGFIGNKLKKSPKRPDGSYASATEAECQAWLVDAASKLGNAAIATHPVKITHSSIRGATSIYAAPGALTPHAEIGTHSIAGEFKADFAFTNASQSRACLLLQHAFEGKTIASWLSAADHDLVSALDVSAGSPIAEMLAKALMPERSAISCSLAKQVYWLFGDDPRSDDQYHLLQPMVSSPLEDVLHEAVVGARGAYFKARGMKTKKATFAEHAAYPGVALRKIGGGNPQNVSPSTSGRGGENYLFASLPPPAWRPRAGKSLLGRDSVFDRKPGAFQSFGEVNQLVREFAAFLSTNPAKTMATRNQVAAFLNTLTDELVMFGASVREHEVPGWTRHASCRLHLCEMLWLDPERAALPARDIADDLAFKDAYDREDWLDEVGERFGLWLNQRLRGHSDKLAMLGEVEMRHFAKSARTAIRDSIWHAPLGRAVKAGAA